MYVFCIFLHILNADYMQMGNVFGDTATDHYRTCCWTDWALEITEKRWKVHVLDTQILAFCCHLGGKDLVDMSGTSSLNQALVDISGTSSTTNPRVIGIELIEHPYYSRSESTTRYPPTRQSGDHWCKIPWRTLEYLRWVWVESHRDVEGSRGGQLHHQQRSIIYRIKLTKLETSTVTAKITRNRWRWNHGWLYTSNWDMMDIYWSHEPSIMMNKQSI